VFYFDKGAFIEPDSYWFARHIYYQLEGYGYNYEPLSYAAYRDSNYANLSNFLPYMIPATLYQIIFDHDISKDKICLLLSVLTPILASLGCVVLFLFLRRLFKNDLLAAVCALTAATIPTFVHRTMSGFYEDDAIMALLYSSILWILYELLSSKKFDLKYGALLILFILVSIFGFVYWNGVGVLFYIILATFGFYVLKVLFNLICSGFKALGGNLEEELKKIDINKYTIPIVSCILALILFFFSAYISGYDLFGMVKGHVINWLLSKEGKGDVLSELLNSEIGEESSEFLRFFAEWPHKYVLLSVFSLLGAILFFVVEREEKMVLLGWYAVTFLMAFLKLKFTYYFGIPCAIFGIYFAWKLSELSDYLVSEIRKLSNIENINSLPAKLIAVILGFGLLTVSLAAGPSHTFIKNIHITKMGLFYNYEDVNELKNLFEYISSKYHPNNLALSWGYGHFTTFFGDLKVAADNTNAYYKIGNRCYYSIMAADVNSIDELNKKCKIDYLLIRNDALFGLPYYAKWYLKTTDSLYMYYVLIARNNYLELPGYSQIYYYYNIPISQDNVIVSLDEILGNYKPKLTVDKSPSGYITFDRCQYNTNHKVFLCFKELPSIGKMINGKLVEIKRTIIIPIKPIENELIKKIYGIDVINEKKLPIFVYPISQNSSLVLMPLANSSNLFNLMINGINLCDDENVCNTKLNGKFLLYKISQ
jgi:asparagine N-glycosylation enzyme membrane subunit Stt3